MLTQQLRLGAVLLVLGLCAQAQTLQRTDSLRAGADTLLLSHDNLVPFSAVVVVVGADTLPSNAYHIDYYRGRLWLRPARPGALLVVHYRHFATPAQIQPFALRQVRPAVKQVTGQRPDSLLYRPPTDTSQRSWEWLQPSKLQRSGSISRAITLGTDRDLGVSSDFRLQLNGLVGNDLELQAAITDENIPIQPSGSTQQLADFDKIFIQLKRRGHYITFGDLEVVQRRSQFANIYRNVLGLQVGGKSQKSSWNVVAASSKGRFHTNSFQGENGRQGPYRLTGRDNERFMIILAGSERVYINGRLMQRGENNDYVIEYNTAELSFTPNRLIDVNARIVVDFEYVVRYYARSFIMGQYEGKLFKDKLSLRASYAREADDADAPIDQQFTQREKELLRAAGTEASLASLGGADSVGYSNTEPRYARIDSTVNSITYTRVFVRSSNPATAHWRVVFGFVGAGRGHYVRDQSLTNNNSFRWVAPVNGQPRGDYDTLRLVPLPGQLQVFNIGLGYQLHRHWQLFTESGISAQDRNRFATGPSRTGVASRTGLRIQAMPLSSKVKLNAELAGQYVDRRYQNHDRIYRLEYGREWNYDDLGPRADERLAEAQLELVAGRGYRIKLLAGLRQYGDSLHSQKYTAELASRDSSALLGQHVLSYTRTADSRLGSSSQWLRHNGDAYFLIAKKQQHGLRIGAELWFEDRRNLSNDTLGLGSFAFADFRPYIRRVGDTTRFSYELSATYRTDQEFFLGAMRAKALTYKPGLRLQWRPTAQLTVTNVTSYFYYTLRDTIFRRQGLDDQRSLLSNLQVNYNSPNRALNIAALYEVGTERVARRQINYLKVTPGLGQYDWLDYNTDGIEQLNEFEQSANPLLANYIRILTPTSQLFPVVRVGTGFTLRLEFKYWQRNHRNFVQRLLHHTSSFTNLRLDQRRGSATDQLVSYLISLARTPLADTSLLSAGISFRQDLYFFRNHPSGDFSFGYLYQQQRQFLNSGGELREQRTWLARQRLNLSPSRSLEHVVQLGYRSSLAELFASRNFDIYALSTNPSLHFQFSRRARLVLGYEYKYKQNRDLVDSLVATVRTHKISFESRLNFKQRNNLNVKLELLENRLGGLPNSSAGFELLEGLRVGRNMVWNLLFTQYLTRILELSVVYDGRLAPGQPTLHSARVQLRAIF